MDPEDLLGKISETPLADLVESEKQKRFGEAKWGGGLAEECRNCEYLPLCHGGCLRNRLPERKEGKDLNYLCEGYRRFFSHTKPYFEAMVRALKEGPKAREYAAFLNPGLFEHVGRNDACPCGSGKKYKHCHGKGR